MVARHLYSHTSAALAMVFSSVARAVAAQDPCTQDFPVPNSVWVDPKGAPTDGQSNTSGNTVTFTVTNLGTCPETYSFSGSGSGSITGLTLSPSSAPLNPGANVAVVATYTLGAPGTGILSFTAAGVIWADQDSGSYHVTVHLPPPPNGAPVVDVSPYNFDKQDYGRCANACFAAMTSRGTVPYFSLDAPRQVVLTYNGDRVNPHPFVLVNVSPDLSHAGMPTQYQLQVKVNGALVTFINGEQTLHFAYPGSAPARVGGQFDASSYSTGVYPMDILVSALYSGTLYTNDVITKLVVVNETTSPLARGWSIAGVQRLYGPYADGSAVVVEGDGGAVYFSNPFGSFVSPAGEFSRLVPSSLSGSAGWARVYPDSTYVVFNSAGLMTKVLDRFGNRDSVVYDVSNRVSKVMDPVNLAFTLSYGTFGLASVGDPGGRFTNVIVDASHRLTSVTDPDNVSTSFGYDGTLRLSTITNRSGATTTLGYDAQAGTFASLTAPSVSFYDGTSGSPVTAYSAWQRVGVPYTATALSPPTPPLASAVTASVTQAAGEVTRFSVNRWGAQVQVTDALGGVTTTTYDSNGLPIKTVHPSGAVDSSSYNASGLPTFIQTGDATNRRVIAYGGWAQRVSASGGPQPAMQAYLGVNGRVDSAWTGSCCSKTKYLYDSRGQVVSTTDPQGHLLGKHWYAGINGNHSRDSLPGGWITTYSYDAFGRDTAVTGPLAPVRRAHYDVLNRPIQFYDGVYASPTAVAYDSMGHTRSVTDEKGQVYGFTYNALGWLTARTDPTGHADTLKYNRDGQVLRQINRRGQTVSFAYDALHRDTSKTGTNTDTDRWSYSTDGRVIAATSPIATETVYLNVRGQPDSTSSLMAGQTFWRRYHYSSIGLLDSVAVTGGGIAFRARKYTYDPNLLTVTGIRLGATSAGTTTRQFNVNRQPTTATYRGGDQVVWQYDARNAVGSAGTSSPYANYVNQVLAYDGEGRLTAAVDSTGNNGFQFTYDGLGRLTSDSTIVPSGPPPPQCSGWPPPDLGTDGSICVYGGGTPWTTTGGVAFTYDSVGNRRDQGGAYTTGNRITAFAGCTYATDLDGNVTSRACPGQSVTFKWTADSRLDTVVVGTQTLVYYYDGAARLVRKDSSGTVKSYFLWDGSNLLAELNASATGEVAEYSYFLGLDNPHATVVGGVEYDMHSDLLSNVVALTDSLQTVKRTYQYDAWGNLTGGADNLPFGGVDRVRWKGALWFGNEANLYYMRNRWYEPQTGRFLSEDPAGLDAGTNLYTYAGDDPVNLRDPSGTCEQVVEVTYDDGSTDMYCADGVQDGGSSDGAGGGTEVTICDPCEPAVDPSANPIEYPDPAVDDACETQAAAFAGSASKDAALLLVGAGEVKEAWAGLKVGGRFLSAGASGLVDYMASLGRAAEPTLSRLWAQFTGNATIGAAVIVSTQPENLTELIGDKINAAITETNWMDLIPFNEAVRLHGEYTACLDSQLH